HEHLDPRRPDYLSPYGNDWVETPLLQELADTGTLFEVCYATTNSTAPSHASIMSSLYLQDHRLTQNGLRLPSAVETIAERFKKAGYRTAAAVSVFHLSHYTAGIGQGFDHFISPPAGVHHPSAEQTNARIDALLDGPLADQPLFLWIHYFDPHAPYEPPGKFDRLYYPGSDPSAANHTGLGMGAPEDRSSNAYWSWLDGVRDLDFVKRQYGAELTYTDAMLGQILKRIREEEPRTLTVVTADHGESLGEHGILTDHLGLHDPVTRVPLILNGPGVPAAHRVAGAVSTVDIAPTLIELCGLRALPLARGRSLVPFFESAKSPAGDVFFEHAKGWQRGVRRGGKKLLEHLVDISASYRGYVFETGRKELYDLNEDPLELKDLGRSAESFEELETLLKRFRESRVGDFEQGSGQMSPELERMLEALGYLGGEDDKDR
ncbi:MAG: sulfatase, partial [Planctomycetota bacterium]